MIKRDGWIRFLKIDPFFQFNDALLHNDPVDGLKRIEKIYIGIMAASASKSTYLYFLLVNEFKHDDDFENQNMNYAEWIEEGYNKIPQVSRSNAALPIIPRIGDNIHSMASRVSLQLQRASS